MRNPPLMLFVYSVLLVAKHCGKPWRCKDEQEGIPINNELSLVERPCSQDQLHSG